MFMRHVIKKRIGQDLYRKRVLKSIQGCNTNAPIIIQHPAAAERAARSCLDNLEGMLMYAVKANNSPTLIKTLATHGIQSFDVASLLEIQMVQKLIPSAILNFMNPVKNEKAIRAAYFDHGVRSFSLHSKAELDKIMRATQKDDQKAQDLTLCVRIQIESRHAMLSLDGKYLLDDKDAVELLQAASKMSHRLGICFHVGSQSMDPEDYVSSIMTAHDLASRAAVGIHIINVGGGFPVEYPGMNPPPLSAYWKAIHQSVAGLPMFREAQVWLEPGRALAAKFQSLVVRVELIVGKQIFINDGLWGNLYDAVQHKWPFEMVLLRESPSKENLQRFFLAGPTPDSADSWGEPCHLPGDIAEGDLILIKNIGAYGTVLRTTFVGCSEGENEVLLLD